jgi:hypothetical protein
MAPVYVHRPLYAYIAGIMVTAVSKLINDLMCVKADIVDHRYFGGN